MTHDGRDDRTRRTRWSDKDKNESLVTPSSRPKKSASRSGSSKRRTPSPSPSVSPPALLRRSKHKSKEVEYNRLTPPKSVSPPAALPVATGLTATVPVARRSDRPYSGNKTAPAPSLVVLDSGAPLAVPGDQLEDVLPHVPVSASEAELVDSIVDDAVRSALANKPAAMIPSASANATWPAPLVVLEGNKRQVEISPGSDVEPVQKKAKSPPPVMTAGAVNLQEYYSFEAKELLASIEKHEKAFAEEVTILQRIEDSSGGPAPALPSLDLPAGGTRMEKSVLRNFPSDLAEIQEALRAQPIDEERTILTIEEIMRTWTVGYEGKPFPPDLETLVSHLKAVVARLGGDGGHVMDPAPAPAAEQVRALVGRLEAASAEIDGGMEQIKGDRPRIERRLANFASVRAKQREIIAIHEEMAADARRREATVADMEAADAARLRAHDDAVRVATNAASILRKRCSEAEALLTRDDGLAGHPQAADGLLPEVAIILAYKAPE